MFLLFCCSCIFFLFPFPDFYFFETSWPGTHSVTQTCLSITVVLQELERGLSLLKMPCNNHDSINLLWMWRKLIAGSRYTPRDKHRLLRTQKPHNCGCLCIFISHTHFFSVFRDKVSLCNNPGYPGTLSVDQAGLELTEIRLPPKCWD